MGFSPQPRPARPICFRTLFATPLDPPHGLFLRRRHRVIPWDSSSRAIRATQNQAIRHQVYSMNRVALLLVLALSLPLTARADEASHRAKAQQMMALLHTDKNVQQVVDNIGREVAEAADKAVGADPTRRRRPSSTTSSSRPISSSTHSWAGSPCRLDSPTFTLRRSLRSNSTASSRSISRPLESPCSTPCPMSTPRSES